jgi:hypothetical protein
VPENPAEPGWLANPAGISQRDEVIRESLRIEEDATYASQAQYESAKSWQLIGWSLGVPAAALAAVAGITGLASTSGRVPAAIIALAAAALGGVLAALEPNKKAEHRRATGVAYDEVRVALRQFRLIEVLSMADPQATTRLGEVSGQKQKIDKIAALPSNRQFGRAVKNLERGRLTHAVDAPDDRAAESS